MHSFVLALALIGCTSFASSQGNVLSLDVVNKALSWSAQQVYKTYIQLPDNTEPARIDPLTGEWKWFNTQMWYAGMFPGCLWEMYKIHTATKLKSSAVPGVDATSWASMANASMQRLAPNAFMTSTHDIGFIVQIPFGTSLTTMGSADTSSAAILIRAANSLSTRFIQSAGVIRSWNNVAGQSSQGVQVIIDNMLNLELLLQASKLPGGKSLWYDQAVSHARVTALHHFRPDHSTFHVVTYNFNTGAVMSQDTAQGYASWSCWSRGQSWAIAGYTMMYRETQLKEFLTIATDAADYFISNLPPDMVPLWDFQAPRSMPFKDTSAAAIAASGFAELDFYAPGRGYLKAAVSILTSLTQSYLSSQPTAIQYASVLLNGSSAAMLGGYNQGLIYGDYYFLKALRMTIQQGGGVASLGGSGGNPTPTGQLQLPSPSPTSTSTSPKPSPRPSPIQSQPSPSRASPSPLSSPRRSPSPTPSPRASPSPSPLQKMPPSPSPSLTASYDNKIFNITVASASVPSCFNLQYTIGQLMAVLGNGGNAGVTSINCIPTVPGGKSAVTALVTFSSPSLASAALAFINGGIREFVSQAQISCGSTVTTLISALQYTQFSCSGTFQGVATGSLCC